MSFKEKLLRYWYALNASAVQSAAHAVKAFAAVSVVHSVSGDVVPAMNWWQIGAVATWSFVSAAADYLDAHPLPEPVAPAAPVEGGGK